MFLYFWIRIPTFQMGLTNANLEEEFSTKKSFSVSIESIVDVLYSFIPPDGE